MQYSDTVTVIASFTAKPGKSEALTAALQSLIKPTRQEPGNLRYELHHQLDEPDVITMVEKFKDLEAFETHKTKPYLIEFLEKSTELAESSSVTVHREVID